MTIDLRMLKRYLITLIAAVSVIIVIDQAYSFMCPQIAHEAVRKIALEDLFSPNAISMEPLQTFQDAVVKRNLFNVAEAHSGGIERKTSIADLVKDYRLKGIAFFTAPEGIIEDATTGRSVFVKEGENLGQVTVKQIKAESVVLSHDGEEVELKIQGGEIQ